MLRLQSQQSVEFAAFDASMPLKYRKQSAGLLTLREKKKEKECGKKMNDFLQHNN
jgi:hypothetical protein